jgi:hypothetical protein
MLQARDRTPVLTHLHAALEQLCWAEDHRQSHACYCSSQGHSPQGRQHLSLLLLLLVVMVVLLGLSAGGRC